MCIQFAFKFYIFWILENLRLLQNIITELMSESAVTKNNIERNKQLFCMEFSKRWYDRFRFTPIRGRQHESYNLGSIDIKETPPNNAIFYNNTVWLAP